MIIIIYSVCPIFTNPPDWRKALSNGVKTHLFKLKTSKTGAVLSCVEKKWFLGEGGGNDWNTQYIPLLKYLNKNQGPPQQSIFYFACLVMLSVFHLHWKSGSRNGFNYRFVTHVAQVLVYHHQFRLENQQKFYLSSISEIPEGS